MLLVGCATTEETCDLEEPAFEMGMEEILFGSWLLGQLVLCV
jgi:hypothetical protein